MTLIGVALISGSGSCVAAGWDVVGGGGPEVGGLLGGVPPLDRIRHRVLTEVNADPAGPAPAPRLAHPTYPSGYRHFHSLPYVSQG